MNARTRILGAATNWLAFATALAVSFFLTPFYVNTLGKNRYDVWCVVESILSYFTLLDMGIAACLVRSVARNRSLGDFTGLNKLASVCLVVFLAAAGVAFLIGTPILLVMSEKLEARAQSHDVLPFMLLMLANLALSLPLSVFPSILDGLERFTEKSIVRIFAIAFRTAGVVMFIDGSGLLPLAYIYTVVTLVEHLLLAGLCFWFLPGLTFSWSLVDRAAAREVRGYGTDAFLAMLAGRITAQTGALLVWIFLAEGDVTIFAVAYRLVEYAKTLLRTITGTLTPGVGAMEAKGDMEGIRQLFFTAGRWVLYIVLPINLGLWFFGMPFLHRWVGESIARSAFPAMAILATTLALGVAQSTASRVLYGLGKLRYFARLALVESVLNIIVTLLLVHPLGMSGVAWGVALPNLLFCFLVIRHLLGILQISTGDYLNTTWRKPLLAAVVPGTIWFLNGSVEPRWDALVAGILVGLIPGVIVAMAIEFGPPKFLVFRLWRILTPAKV